MIAFLGFMRRGVKKQQGTNGAIRIISGQWRGRKLPVLNAEGLRPTTDRTKETLFNWLMTDIRESRCLDCFAGSGGLGFEALSRYANSVTFVEKDTSAANQLQQNIKTLKLQSSQAELVKGDALSYLQQATEPFDLIFLDPPFNKGLITESIKLIDSRNLLTEDGLIYIECETENASYPVPQNWQGIKQKQTKQVDYRLYQNCQ